MNDASILGEPGVITRPGFQVREVAKIAPLFNAPLTLKSWDVRYFYERKGPLIKLVIIEGVFERSPST